MRTKLAAPATILVLLLGTIWVILKTKNHNPTIKTISCTYKSKINNEFRQNQINIWCDGRVIYQNLSSRSQDPTINGECTFKYKMEKINPFTKIITLNYLINFPDNKTVDLSGEKTLKISGAIDDLMINEICNKTLIDMIFEQMGALTRENRLSSR